MDGMLLPDASALPMKNPRSPSSLPPGLLLPPRSHAAMHEALIDRELLGDCHRLTNIEAMVHQIKHQPNI